MKQINTYLMFDGNCREAMTFYNQCLGAELNMMTYGEMPGQEASGQCNIPEEAKGRIMHACVNKGPVMLMASDIMPGMPGVFTHGNNFSVNISCESVQEIEGLFTAFGNGGKITMPLQETFWAARFGMLTDQFGIDWMFNLEHAKEE